MPFLLMPLKHNKDTISLENSLIFALAAGHTFLKKMVCFDLE